MNKTWETAQKAIDLTLRANSQKKYFEQFIEKGKVLSLLAGLVARLEAEGVSVHGPKIEMELYQEQFKHAQQYVHSLHDNPIGIQGKQSTETVL